jgi:hypothetical protein
MMFNLFNNRMQCADDRIIDKYIAIRTSADGQLGLVKRTFIDRYSIV